MTRLPATLFLIASPFLALAQEAEQPVAPASIESTERATNWKSWVYAGAALGAAAIGMTFIALNQGSESR